MGRFIVIDGLDGSGKETQTKLLTAYLESIGQTVRVLSFPCYESQSSLFVRMYLGGELGDRPDDTNAFAASSFFAADRYLSYRLDWQKDIEDPHTVVIANRYTTANAVHQLSKMPREGWDAFLDWLGDFEFDRLGLPRPDLTVYLEMTPEISMRLVSHRSDTTGQQKDIHELDPEYMNKCYEAGMYAADKLGFVKIDCCEGGVMRSREAIADEIYSKIPDID